MQLNCQKTCDQSQQSNHERVEDIKKTITYTNSQLHKLISNEQIFSQRIKQLNRNAVKQINNQLFDEAIVYLNEAQKNLQYAASCGMTIDRILIITTLKNLACGYQRLWQLATCYDYIQALILNISIQNDDHEKLLKMQSIKERGSNQYDKLSKITSNKLKLAISYLQFSALSSQLGRHDQATNNVHKSLGEFKSIIQICHAYELLVKGKTSILLENIRGGIELKGNQQIGKKMMEAKKGLQKIKQHVYFFSFDSALIQKVSMGDIMQVRCTTVEEEREGEGITWFTSQIGLTYMSIYISCCFFALATQIRLTIPEQDRLRVEHHSQLQFAKLHHLYSIILASQFVLIQSNYLNHIVKSFKNNFKIDLIEDQYQIQGPYQSGVPIIKNQIQQSMIKGENIKLKIPLEESRNDEGIQVDIRESIKNRNKLKIKKNNINQLTNNILEIKKISQKKKIIIDNNHKLSKNKFIKNYISQKNIHKIQKNNCNQVINNYYNQIKHMQKSKKSETGNDKKIQNEYYQKKQQNLSNQKRVLSPSASSRGREKIKKKYQASNTSRSQKYKQKIKIIKSPKKL